MAVERTPTPITERSVVIPAVREAETPGSVPAAIRAHLLVVILVVLATIGASAAYVAKSSPTYKATARLLVSPTDATTAPFLDIPLIVNSGDPVRTLETAVILMDTSDTAAIAARTLGNHWTAARVHAAVQVLPAGQSNIVDVTASAESPRMAVQLANVYVNALLAGRKRTFQTAGANALRIVQAQLAHITDPNSATATALEREVGVLQAMAAGIDPNIAHAESAVAGGGRQGPPPWLVEVLAVLAGLVLATGTALLLEAVAPRRIRNEKELLQVYRLSILARLPAGRQWRGRSVHPRQLGIAAQEAFRSVRLQLELMVPRPRALMITSPTGNDGKTVTAVGLALELAASGASVILVDADLRSPGVRRVLELDDHVRDHAASLPTFVPLDDLLEDVPDVKGLKLLELRQFTESDAAQAVTTSLAEVIEQASGMADYVIVDTSPLGEVSDALPLIRAVDEVLVVVRLHNSRRTSLEVTRDLLVRSSAGPAGYIVVGSSDMVSTHPYYPSRPSVERAR
jgi:Mrp family chromosome partitioning ATPase/capsular polysaccharide biosynthesis protein